MREVHENLIITHPANIHRRGREIFPFARRVHNSLQTKIQIALGFSRGYSAAAICLFVHRDRRDPVITVPK